MKKIDMTGWIMSEHGVPDSRLTVVAQCVDFPNKWQCICSCGNLVCIDGQKIRTGHTKSCGCLNNELRIKRNYKHGGAIRNHHEKLYDLWTHMLYRCEKPNTPHYEYYGGRGISVCDEWHTYDNFRNWSYNNGYTVGLSIDRIDPNKNYTPENCRWIPFSEQSANRRNKTHVLYNGIDLTITEWSNHLGVTKSKIRRRLQKYKDSNIAIQSIIDEQNP